MKHVIKRSIESKFWSFVTDKPASSCWEWKGSKHIAGYGTICFKYKPFLAHRLSWTIHFGEIPAEMFICHHCDNRICVRPDHLFLGTPMDNVEDMIGKGRARMGSFELKKTSCPRGHKYSAQNTYIFKTKTKGSGTGRGRACKKCRIMQNRKWRLSAKKYHSGQLGLFP